MMGTTLKLSKWLFDSEKNKIILAFAISFFVLLILLVRTHLMDSGHPDFAKPWDHHKYIFMAQHNLDFHIAPYCWRILNPLFASILPFSIQTNFLILSIFFLWFSANILFLILRKLNFTFIESLTGIFLFYFLGWAVKFNLYDFWLTEPLMFFLLLVGIYLILLKKDLLFFLIVFLSSMVKEALIILPFLYFSINICRNTTKKILYKSILAVGLFLLSTLLLRSLIPAFNEQLSYVNSLAEELRYWRDTNSYYSTKSFILAVNFVQPFPYLAKEYIGSFSLVLIFLSIFDLKKNLKVIARYLPLLLFSLLFLFYPVDIVRVIIFSFFLFIFMALNGLRKIRNYFSLNEHIGLGISVFLFCLNLINSNRIMITLAVQSVIILIIALSFVLVKSFRKSSYKGNIIR